jgi:hypothetical protein
MKYIAGSDQMYPMSFDMQGRALSLDVLSVNVHADREIFLMVERSVRMFVKSTEWAVKKY